MGCEWAVGKWVRHHNPCLTKRADHLSCTVIEQFTIDVPMRAIDELNDRLRHTCWPSGVTDSGGFPVSDARDLVSYWADSYDWFPWQARLNEYSQFIADIDGLQVHFVHVKSGRRGALPLLLLHGWPGSFIEFLSVIDRLRDNFDIVVPSLPGFGFSAAPLSPGMSNRKMADVMTALMMTLGYERFGVNGGDVGAGVATWIARQHGNHVIGLHLNYLPGSYSPALDVAPSDDEASFLCSVAEWYKTNGAYSHAQGTRPLTLSYGLSDSPVGLATWIAEKFQNWSDPGYPISLDTVLTNVMIYQLTNSIASSVRVYLESAATPLNFASGEKISIPTAFAQFPFEISSPPRSWIERVYNVKRWTVMPQGGHFAALEVPNLLSDDIADFFTRAK